MTRYRLTPRTIEIEVPSEVYESIQQLIRDRKAYVISHDYCAERMSSYMRQYASNLTNYVPFRDEIVWAPTRRPSAVVNRTARLAS